MSEFYHFSKRLCGRTRLRHYRDRLIDTAMPLEHTPLVHELQELQRGQNGIRMLLLRFPDMPIGGPMRDRHTIKLHNGPC